MPRFELQEPSQAEIEFLDDRLYAHNAAVTGIDDGRLLGVFLRDAEGKLLAAAAGHTWGETCELKQVWVEPELRGQGVGRALIEEAEAEALRRGCKQIVLSTHSFQAPDMYRKLGYEVIAEVADYPRGHANVVMRKRLSA